MAEEAEKPGLLARSLGFARETATIVLGVVIALVGEQIVSDRNWKSSVASAEGSMKYELGEMVAYIHEQTELRPCLNTYLDTAERIVLDPVAMQGKRLPSQAGITSMPWSDSAWQAAVSAQIPDHMPRERLQVYAEVYEVIRALKQDQESLIEPLALIRTITPDRPMTDPGVVQSRIDAISSMRLRTGRQDNVGQQVIDEVRAKLGVTLKPATLREVAATRAACEAAPPRPPPAAS